MDRVFNQYWPGALVGIIALLVFAYITSRPLPPPGTAWPERRVRRPSRLRPSRYREEADVTEDGVEDAVLIIEPDDERLLAELRRLRRQLPPPLPPQWLEDDDPRKASIRRHPSQRRQLRARDDP